MSKEDDEKKSKDSYILRLNQVQQTVTNVIGSSFNLLTVPESSRCHERIGLSTFFVCLG